jgi:hypothetical protein
LAYLGIDDPVVETAQIPPVVVIRSAQHQT